MSESMQVDLFRFRALECSGKSGSLFVEPCSYSASSRVEATFCLRIVQYPMREGE